MSDRAYAKVQTQQKTLTGSLPGSRLLQRTCACGQHTIAGAECSMCRSEQSTSHRSQRAFGSSSSLAVTQGNSPAQEHVSSFNAAFDRASRLEHDFSQIPIHPPAARVIQTKLAINKPGDEYEREADRISEQVMRMPEPPLQQPGQEHERLQTKHIGSGDLGERTVPPIVHEVLGSPGRPLDPAARAFTESRFGHDFSQVRLHTDTKAAESARAVNSLAYTVGQHVVFGTGRYAPGTTEGGRLLAHELTHVVQQTGVLQRQQTPAGPVPDISSSGEYRIGEVLGGVGVATTIGSILETGGTMTAAGVFGTLSGLLLPAGAFLLGTSIAEERERQKAKLAEFKMKLVGSAMLEAVAKLRSKLASTQHGKMAHLNERGHQAVNKISQAWREKMSDEFDWKWGLWTSIPYFNPSMLAAALQPVYENWVNGNAEDLYRIFADSNMTMP